jgi:hypothetical protein
LARPRLLRGRVVASRESGGANITAFETFAELRAL